MDSLLHYGCKCWVYRPMTCMKLLNYLFSKRQFVLETMGPRVTCGFERHNQYLWYVYVERVSLPGKLSQIWLR